ncbi:MAG: terminase [Terriglobales bacterium]
MRELTAEFLQRLGQQLDDPAEFQRQSGEWQRKRRDEFIESHLKIRTKKAAHNFLILNRTQQAYSDRCTSQNVVLKARQVGITTYIAARFFTETISCPGTVSMQVTQDRESAEDIFRIVRRFWENLPEEIRKGYLRTSHRNARQLVFQNLDSEYCLASAAENAGRGRTIQNLHCSEVSRWGRNGDEALVSLRAAVVPGGQIVLESTPNGAGGLFYEEWQRAEETGYTQHFFPWWYDEAYALETGPSFAPLTYEEKALAELHRLTTNQIAWRRKQWASFRGQAVQEFAEDPVSCFRASGECVFDLPSLEEALRGSSEPLHLRDTDRLKIWLPALPGRDYVIGADPAGGGIEGDYSCAEVIDRELGSQCAELHGHWPPREFARELMKLGREYNTALLAVERNNHGYGVLAHLDIEKYPNVFAHDGQAGWLTSTLTRPIMIETFSSVLTEKPELFRSVRLLQECRTFVRHIDGGTGAAPGTHDDCVMAMAIAWAARADDAGRRPRAPGTSKALGGKVNISDV